MSEESSTNAAVEWLRRGMDFLNSVEQPPADAGVTDDFVFRDERSGFNFGRIEGPERYREWLAATWGLTDEQPRFSISEVVAVRGDRCAAVVMNVDYGNEMGIEHIECWRLDPTLRRADRAIAVDLALVDVAMSELDRMHAAVED